MSGGIISFTLMAIAGREASFELDTFEILLYRSIIGFITVLVIAKSLGTLNQIKTQILKQHFYRNIAHFSGQSLWFYALSVIPLAQVFALEFTLPLWVVIFSSPLLGEKITRIKATSVLIGFIGILVIARPNIDNLNPGVLTAALSAVGFAFTVIFTKRLTTTESITCILFYLTSMQLIFGLIAAGLDGNIMIPSTNTTYWLVLIGFAGLTAHFCVTKALSISSPSLVMPIDFVRLPIIAFVGLIFYSEPIDIPVFYGSILIFYANWLNLTKGGGGR